MKATLINANTLRAAKIAVDNKIRELNPRNLDKRYFVIVPDRSTVDAEKALLDVTGGSFNVQVVTFKKFASLFVKTDLNYLTKQNGVLLLSRVADKNSKNLKCFKDNDSAGFVAKTYDLISGLKYAGVTPQQLSQADLPQEVKDKAADVALLYSEYAAATEGRFFDSADTLQMLFDSLNAQNLKNCGFFVYDFLSFSAQEKNILSRLVSYADFVTVAAVTSDDARHKPTFDNAVRDAVYQVCQRLKTPLKKETFVEYANGNSSHILNNVYAFGRQTVAKSKNDMYIVAAGDLTDECKNLACFIDGYVKNGGKYGDVKVVCSDVKTYRYALNEYFKEYGIPTYIDVKQTLDRSFVSRFATDFLRMSLNNFKQDSVLPFVKNPLFGGDASAFETFCLKYNISYRFDAFDIGKEDELFSAADETRAKLKKIIDDFVVPRFDSAKNYVDLLKRLAASVDAEQKEDEFVKWLKNNGMAEDASRVEQARKKTEQVFDQTAFVLGDGQMPLDGFIRALESALASQSVSVVPTLYDCVRISNLDKGKNHDVKVLCVIGANEGELPKIKKSCGLLSDKNISALNERGISLEPSLSEENRREKFSVLNLLAEPTDTLYVSYKTTDGKELRPSSFVNTLRDCFADKNGTYPFPLTSFAGKYGSITTLKRCVTKALIRKKSGAELSDGQKRLCDEFGARFSKYIYDDGKIPDINNGTQLFFKNDALSVTRIETFFGCPYRHFIQHGAGLREKPSGEFKVNDFGTILHSVFEKFVDKIIAGKNPDDDTAAKIFDEVLSDDKYSALAKSGKGGAFCRRLKKEAVLTCQKIKAQIQNSDFKPLSTEYRFGFDKKTALKCGKGENAVLVKGVVDRIDGNGQSLVIMDYKTGKAVFDEKKLYVGKKLQLPVYSHAVGAGFKKPVVGCFYYKISNDYVREEKQPLVGRIVDNPDVIRAMDNDLISENKSRLFKVKFNKDGSIDGKSAACADKQRFDGMQTYALRLVENAGELMRQGYVDVNPVNGECDYCPCVDICGFNDVKICEVRQEPDALSTEVFDFAEIADSDGDKDKDGNKEAEK